MPWLLVGTAVGGVMYFPHALQLAYGQARVALIIQVAMLAALCLSIIPLTRVFGITGAAVAWALANAVNLLLGAWLTHRTMLRGLGPRWLAIDVGAPALVSFAIIGLGGRALAVTGAGDWPTLLSGIVLALIAMALTTRLFPRLLTEARHILTAPAPLVPV